MRRPPRYAPAWAVALFNFQMPRADRVRRSARNATVDLETGAIYVRVADGEVDHTNELIADLVMVDIAADGTVLGIEVLP